MASIGSVMNVMFNSILNTFGPIIGDYGQKAFGAYFKLQSFIFMPVFGLNNGIVPIVAYNYGAQKRRRMMGTVKLGITYAVGYMALGLLAFQLIPEILIRMFLTEPAAIAVAIPCLRIVSLSFIFAGFCIIVGSVFQALGKSIYSMFVSVARQLIVLIPVAYLLAKLGSIEYVWWAFPIAEVMSMAVSTVFLIRIYKKIIAKIPN
jgi:Na+-driven multidrug efflux pump